MKIIRKINNNAAIAQDKRGRELVVLGRGVGFHPVPYELTDLSVIYQAYYDVNPKYFGLAGELPPEIILAATEISEQAEFQLDCELNPNLPFTLADHLNFAMERQRKGIQLAAPLGYDVRHLYSKESRLGHQALDLGEPNPYRSCSEWGITIDPLGFRIVLHNLYDRYGLPIMVAENGLGSVDTVVEDGRMHDPYRIDFYRAHIRAMKDAMEVDGVDVMGYTPCGWPFRPRLQ